MQEIQEVTDISPWDISMHDRPSVLIVDDDKEVRDGLQYALSSYNMDVTLCENGNDALRAAMRGYYDYIITDFKMPGMHGIELVRRLRTVQPAPVVIIGMSSLDMGGPFLKAGANDFVVKPFEPLNVAMMLDGGDIPALSSSLSACGSGLNPGERAFPVASCGARERLE